MSKTLKPAPWYSWDQWDNLEPYNLLVEGRSGLTCCPLNSLTDVTVDSEDVNFPIENTSDDHPKRIYRAEAGVDNVRLNGSLPAGTESFFIFNTNAIKIKVAIDDYVHVEWHEGNEWFQGNEWWPEYTTPVSSEIVESGERNAVGILFDRLPGTKNIAIELSSPGGEAVEVGILWAGATKVTNNFAHGLQENQIDYSITKELSNGARYYKKRDIVRTFSGRITEEHPEWTDKLLLDVSRKYGKKAMPWIITDVCDSRWLVFGGLSRLISATYKSYKFADMSISITEVL